MKPANYLQAARWFLPFRIMFSGLYRLIISARNFFYDHGVFKIHNVKTPVISVGNISVGGSGKTILVQSLLDYFLSNNKKPAVLSRGYGRQSKGLHLVATESTLLGTPGDSGDEPFLIANNFPGVPVVVSEDRVKGAKYIGDIFSPDVIILDDGYQHRRLNRDLNILIIDFPSTQKNHVLPWGVLRENARNSDRADIVLYSKEGQRLRSDFNLDFTLDLDVFDHAGKGLPLATLSGNYGLFAGLGKPHSFFNSVHRIHPASVVQISFPDHSIYGKKQLDAISAYPCDYWLTTQKDFIKLDPRFCKQKSIYFVKVSTRLPAPLFKHLKKFFK